MMEILSEGIVGILVLEAIIIGIIIKTVMAQRKINDTIREDESSGQDD